MTPEHCVDCGVLTVPDKKEERNITLPIEVMDKLADILWQDMNFHNPHEILIQARTLLLELGITLRYAQPRTK